MAEIAASHPDWWPAHSWSDPAAAWMSSLRTLAIALPIILQAVSAIPISLTREFI